MKDIDDYIFSVMGVLICLGLLAMLGIGVLGLVVLYRSIP